MAQFTGQVKWFNTKVFDFVGDCGVNASYVTLVPTGRWL
jgi:hypothetical protein